MSERHSEAGRPSIQQPQGQSSQQLTSDPDACTDYMAESRRGPLTRDHQRPDEAGERRGSRRDRDQPRRGRSGSPGKRLEHIERAERRGETGVSIRGRAAAEEEGRRERSQHRHEKNRSRSSRRHRSKSSYGSPKYKHREDRAAKSGQEHTSKATAGKREREWERERERERFASPESRRHKRQRTNSPDFRPDNSRPGNRARGAEPVELFPETVEKPRDRAKGHPHRRVSQDRANPSRSCGRENPHRGHDPHHRLTRGRSRSPEREAHGAEYHSRKHRSPERRWRRAEIDEYYREEEEEWERERRHRHRRNSPRTKRAAYGEHYRSRDPSPHERSRARPYHNEYDRYKELDYRYSETQYRERSSRRGNSRSPAPSRRPRNMQETKPIQSVLDSDRDNRSRPIPNFDSNRGGSRGRGGYRGRGGGSSHFPPPPGPPHIDTRPQQQYVGTPHYAPSPAASYQGSPHSASPYSQGPWGAHTPQYYNAPPAHAYVQTQTHQSSYPPPSQTQAPYYQQSYQHSPPHAQSHFSPVYRGGLTSMRGGYPPQQDRRFSAGSAAGSPPYSAPPVPGRGRHFQNLQWTASGGTRGGKQPENNTPGQRSREHSVQTTAPPPPPPVAAPTERAPSPPNERAPSPPEEDNPFRPSKAFRVEDEGSKEEEKSKGDGGKDPESPTATKEGSKFSFAFKGKAASAPVPKPVADLTQKMKEPPLATRREPPPEAPKKPAALSREPALPSKPRADRRPDPRDRYQDDRYDDRRDGEYDSRYPYERRPPPRDLRYPLSRDDRRPPPERERVPFPPRERILEKPKAPEMVKAKKLMKRPKPRPQLESELKTSKSVYYRKHGNESVVGSGTYGKVYKAVHVYTKALVALKKIRMEGEKDGFPVTAVREIKLLQSLRHENIVRLHEVMVESNDCYMVFEYLSHDLTGLLNHPTFRLEHAHKKHLAHQLFRALDYLHRRGVLHRDLKAANILVSSDGQLKLADFGLARFYAKRHQLDYTNRVITIWYRPPELLLGETQYGAAVDIWSAACVLIEIFTKHAIFPGDGGEINQLEKIYNVLGTPTRVEWPGIVDMAWFELLRPAERRMNAFADRYRDKIPSLAAFELLEAMFQYDPARRPSAEEVLEHPYFVTEEPSPAQVTELKDIQGDWHEFESKALRKDNERKARKVAEAERAEREREKAEEKAEKAKRRASSHGGGDMKRAKSDKEDEAGAMVMAEEQTVEVS